MICTSIKKKLIIISVIWLVIIIPCFICSALSVGDGKSEISASTIDEVSASTIDEVETEATEKPTEKPTQKPTEKPTEPPTEPPTEVEVSNPCAPVEPSEPGSTLNPKHTESTFYLSESERYVVESLVMGEAGGESYDLQVLTAQCILNACVQDNLQPSEVMSVYQYFGWNNCPTDSVKDAVSAVFDDGYSLTDEPILYFYAPHLCYSDWHESQRYILTQDGIRFFARW
jgi:hypothetical protein